MLDLMDFKEEFVSGCRDALCESGPMDMEIEERRISKAQRGVLNGILFKKTGLECAPTFYVEDFYNAYRSGAPVSELSRNAVDAAVRSMDLAGLLARDSMEMLGAPDNLRVRMLSKSRNKDYLKGKPFRELGCGFVYIAEIGFGEYGAVITDELIKGYRMSVDELFDRALRNTMESYPAILNDLGWSVMGGPEECENLLEGPAGMAPAGVGPGFVLTNSSFFWGAGALFYPGVIGRIHELLDGDFYVLPSSVHELILLAADGQDPRRLADLIRSANRTVVKENEVLAEDLFICDPDGLHRVSYGGMIPVCGSMLC